MGEKSASEALALAFGYAVGVGAKVQAADLKIATYDLVVALQTVDELRECGVAKGVGLGDDRCPVGG